MSSHSNQLFSLSEQHSFKNILQLQTKKKKISMQFQLLSFYYNIFTLTFTSMRLWKQNFLILLRRLSYWSFLRSRWVDSVCLINATQFIPLFCVCFLSLFFLTKKNQSKINLFYTISWSWLTNGKKSGQQRKRLWK